MFNSINAGVEAVLQEQARNLDASNPEFVFNFQGENATTFARVQYFTFKANVGPVPTDADGN